MDGCRDTVKTISKADNKTLSLFEKPGVIYTTLKAWYLLWIIPRKTTCTFFELFSHLRVFFLLQTEKTNDKEPQESLQIHGISDDDSRMPNVSTVMCLRIGTPKSNIFTIYSKCKINYF